MKVNSQLVVDMLEVGVVINVIQFEFEWARMNLEKLCLNNNDDRRDEEE